jgi:hypothetical protein
LGVDLLKVAGRGARLAARNRRARGEEDDEIRRRPIVRSLDGISGDDCTRETLAATVQGAVDYELARPEGDASRA